MKKIFGLILLLLFPPSTLIASPCFQYEPTVSILTGKVVRRTFPGRPNYQSVAAGDESETVWVLHLAYPICLSEGEGGINKAEKGINFLQLVLSSDQYKIYKDKVGKFVTATGTFFHSHTGHHHTKVLLTVTDLK